MKQERFYEIDMMRGIALIAIILIHTCYFFITDRVAYTLWNYAQFSVLVFIFCSAFLYFQKEQDSFTARSFFSSLFKRAKRLLFPYYVFLLFFIPIIYFQTPEKVNVEYIFRAFVSYGAVDINWLVLLFLYFALIMPIVELGAKAYSSSETKWNREVLVGSSRQARTIMKVIYGLFVVASLGSSILFLFYKPNLDFRFTMWLPWTVIILFTYYFLKLKKKREAYLLATLFSGVGYALLILFLTTVQHSLSFTSNKYPPNAYYILFGIFSIFVLFKCVQLPVFKRFSAGITFFSKNSYSLYFIHYIILTALVPILKSIETLWHWQILFNTALISSVIIQIAISKLQKEHNERRT